MIALLALAHEEGLLGRLGLAYALLAYCLLACLLVRFAVVVLLACPLGDADPLRYKSFELFPSVFTVICSRVLSRMTVADDIAGEYDRSLPQTACRQ